MPQDQEPLEESDRASVVRSCGDWAREALARAESAQQGVTLLVMRTYSCLIRSMRLLARPVHKSLPLRRDELARCDHLV